MNMDGKNGLACTKPHAEIKGDINIYPLPHLKVQKDLILSVAKENKFVTTCSAGNLSYVSMEDGSLKPCEILKDTLGTIKTSKVNMNKMFFSSEAKNLRKKIINTKCKCTFECAMSSNVLFNGNMVPKIINQTVKDVLKKN